MSTYEQALKDGKKTGASRATDSQALAMLLDTNAQLLWGAVSPKLLWEGAQARGMTMLETFTYLTADPTENCKVLMFDELPS